MSADRCSVEPAYWATLSAVRTAIMSADWWSIEPAYRTASLFQLYSCFCSFNFILPDGHEQTNYEPFFRAISRAHLQSLEDPLSAARALSIPRKSVLAGSTYQPDPR